MPFQVLTKDESFDSLAISQRGDVCIVLVDDDQQLALARNELARTLGKANDELAFVGSSSVIEGQTCGHPVCPLPVNWDTEGDFKHFELVDAWRKMNHGVFVLLPPIATKAQYRFLFELVAVNTTWAFVVGKGAAEVTTMLQHHLVRSYFVRWTGPNLEIVR